MPLTPPSRDKLKALAADQRLTIGDNQLDLLEAEFKLLAKQFDKVVSVDVGNVKPMDYGRTLASHGLRSDLPIQTGFGVQRMRINTARLPTDFLTVKVK